jgi:hypothetical protein
MEEGDDVVELVDCNVEVSNGKGGRHAHCDTADLMVDEVSESHSIVFHYYLHCCLTALHSCVSQMLARKVEIRLMLSSMSMFVYMEMASNVMMLASGGGTILSSSCFSEIESLK